MEEKNSNSQFNQHAQGSVWLWQSDPNPWKEQDSSRWSWTPYLSEVSRCIEAAFVENKKTVDIGHHEIEFASMVQRAKKDRNRMRRVKREIISGSGTDQTPTIQKSQRIMNPAFGDVDHFLDYIMKRTPEAYKVFQRLKDLTP